MIRLPESIDYVIVNHMEPDHSGWIEDFKKIRPNFTIVTSEKAVPLMEAFFDITYEHVNYFTPRSLANLFASVDQQGLLFGDQYQFAIGRLDVSAHAEFGRAYDAKDSWSGLRFEDVFPNFESIIDEIETANADKSIYVWGAATKGVMFCHHLKRLRPTTFDRVKAAIDINPMKAGRFMPSVQLRILDIDALCLEASGDELVVIMNPNYQHEIVAELQARGLDDVRHLCV